MRDLQDSGQEGSRWHPAGPRGSQDGAKKGQNGPKMAPREFKLSQDGAKMAPRWPRDGSERGLRRRKREPAHPKTASTA